MKLIISVLIIIAVYLGLKSVFDQYKKEQDKEKRATGVIEEPAAPPTLPGLGSQFEPSLKTAQAQGAPSLKAWLDKYQSYVRDPRLGDIELDYALLLIRSNPSEAKRIFHDVKARTPTNSPLYPRIKKLDGTLGP
jgi:hypothetical protein